MKSLNSCYLSCGGLFKPKFIKSGFTILSCSKCGLCVLETDTDYDTFLKDYYSQGYFSGGDDKFGYADYLSEELMIKKNMHDYLKEVCKVVPSGSLLDVGCAAGFLLEEAQKLGYQASGVDTSEYIVKQARPEIRPNITCSPLHKAQYEKEHFDIVTMFDLIEHLADPKKDLAKVSEWLKPDGVLVIGTGDIGSLYSKILGAHSHFFAPPHHLFFFSRKTITELLNQIGFEVVSIKAKGKWLTVPYIARVAKHFNFALVDKFFNSSLFQKIFGKMWVYLFFGDNMVVIARKKSV